MTAEWLIPGVFGFVAGAAVTALVKFWRLRTATEVAQEILARTEADRQRHAEGLTETLRAQFGDLSLQALSRNTEEFLKLAQTRLAGQTQEHGKELDAKKGLIDQQLVRLTQELKSVTDLVQGFEKDREQKFGMLSSQIKNASEQTALLTKTTQSLREALASTKARGQWGERMAEDILRSVGFIENVNYRKQTRNSAGTLPDFSFLLPRGLLLNMDVKFPFENYMRFLDAPGDAEKTRFRQDYMRDIKTRIKEVTTRDYINPEENTVDYVLLFIPNEQIYAFIHESDPSLLDSALRQHVVMCSPITLFAVLAVIRQAADNFSMEKTSNEILRLMGSFRKQWFEFTTKMENMGRRIDDARKEFDSLMTTRRNQLERPLRQIDELRQAQDPQMEPAEAEAMPCPNMSLPT